MMNKVCIFLLAFVLPHLAVAQGLTCSQQNYCASGGNSSNEYIDNVVLGSIFNTTTNDGGYGDFTGTSTVLTKGVSYPITISPGFDSIPRNIGFAVYIDFDGNGDFYGLDEQVIAVASSGNNSVTERFIVPEHVPQGPVRMRVSMAYDMIPAPCGTQFLGEVEDYCILISRTKVEPCLAPDSTYEVFQEERSIDMAWAEVVNADAYLVEYNDLEEDVWNGVASFQEYKRLTQLDSCSKYVWGVRSVCPLDTSDRSILKDFSTTGCLFTALGEANYNDELALYPNPFQDELHVSIPNEWNKVDKAVLVNTFGQQLSIEIETATDILHISLQENIPSGVYFLRLSSGDEQFTSRVIKQ